MQADTAHRPLAPPNGDGNAPPQEHGDTASLDESEEEDYDDVEREGDGGGADMNGKGAESHGQADVEGPPAKKQKTKQPPQPHVPGTTTMPFARVQRIIRADKDVATVSKEAIFLISVAAEHCIRKLTDQGYVRARLDKRKLITLKDLSLVARQQPEFAFLQEIIPATVPLSIALAARQRKEVELDNPLAPGPSDNLSHLIPQVALHPSTNPKYPEGLTRKLAHAHGLGKRGSGGKSGAKAGGGSGDEEDGGEKVVKKSHKKKEVPGGVKGKGKSRVEEDESDNPNVRQSARQRQKKQQTRAEPTSGREDEGEGEAQTGDGAGEGAGDVNGDTSGEDMGGEVGHRIGSEESGKDGDADGQGGDAMVIDED